MADLRDTTIETGLSVSSVNNNTGSSAVNIEALNPDCRTLRQIITAVDSTSYSFSTAWAQHSVFNSVLTGCRPGSFIRLSYYSPNRNDSTSWGGLYQEPQVSFNGGAWQSLGSSGYDGAIMILRNQTIASYSNTILIDPALALEFSVSFRFYARSYDGTSRINGSHDINRISGTAPLMGGDNSNQHYFHILVEEYALMA